MNYIDLADLRTFAAYDSRCRSFYNALLCFQLLADMLYLKDFVRHLARLTRTAEVVGC